MKNISFFAFYGTLRQGEYNFLPFQDHIKFIRTVRMQGFTLFDAGNYPYAVKSDNIDNEIVAELVEIQSKNVIEAIHQLELAAGYFLDYVTIDGEKFGIYLMKQNNPQDSQIVDGDWVKQQLRKHF